MFLYVFSGSSNKYCLNLNFYLFRLEGVIGHPPDNHHHHGMHPVGVHGGLHQENGDLLGVSMPPSASDAGGALHLNTEVPRGERSPSPWQNGS